MYAIVSKEAKQMSSYPPLVLLHTSLTLSEVRYQPISSRSTDQSPTRRPLISGRCEVFRLRSRSPVAGRRSASCRDECRSSTGWCPCRQRGFPHKHLRSHNLVLRRQQPPNELALTPRKVISPRSCSSTPHGPRGSPPRLIESREDRNPAPGGRRGG